MFDPIRGVRPTSKEFQKPAQKPAEQPVKAGEASKSDFVELSDGGKIMKKFDEMPPIRAERVAEIKAMLAKGTYMDGKKIDSALDKLLG